MNRLGGLVCLISGSTGIAASSAERFAAEGASVFVTSRNEQHCRKLVDRIIAGGGRAAHRAAELSDEAEVDAAIESCVATFGRIDTAFLVAGASGRRWGDGPIHELTLDGWERTLELNLRTTALAARAVVRQMLAQPPRDGGRRGALLLMSSVTAFEPVPRYFGTHAYAAAKGAVASLATTMAATYAPLGIRVNAVAPSVTDTPMARRAATDPVIVEFARHKQPLAGGLLDPDDVALAATYLLSDEARAVTGQLLAIDGGWSVTSYGPPPETETEA